MDRLQSFFVKFANLDPSSQGGIENLDKALDRSQEQASLTFKDIHNLTKHGLKKGSIYVHDIHVEKILRAMAKTFGTGKSIEDVMPEILREIAAETASATPVGAAVPPSIPDHIFKLEGSTGLPPGSEPRPNHKKATAEIDTDGLGAEIAASTKTMRALVGMTGAFIMNLLGGASEWKRLFAGAFMQEREFTLNMKQIAFSTQGVTGNLKEAQHEFMQIGDVTSQTGKSMTVFEQSIGTNMKKGVRSRKEEIGLTKSALKLSTLIGSEAASTVDEFHNWNVQLGLTTDQLDDVARGIQQVSKDSGVMGGSLLASAQSAKSLMKNMRDAGTLTAESAKSVISLQTSGEKLGVGDKMSELTKALEGSNAFYRESSTKTQSLVLQIANAAGIQPEKVTTGEVLQDPELKKQFFQAIPKQFERMFGVALKDFDKLSAPRKRDINLALAGLGLQANEMKILGEAGIEASQTFADREKKLTESLSNKNLTKDERMQNTQELSKLKMDTSSSFLNKFMAASAEKDSTVNKAVETVFTQNKSLGNDLQAMNIKPTNPQDVVKQVALAQAKSLNAAGAKEDFTSSIERAFSSGDISVIRETLAKLEKTQKEVEVSAAKNIDPQIAASQKVLEVNEKIRHFTSKFLEKIFNAVGPNGLIVLYLASLAASSLAVGGLLQSLFGGTFIGGIAKKIAASVGASGATGVATTAGTSVVAAGAGSAAGGAVMGGTGIVATEAGAATTATAAGAGAGIGLGPIVVGLVALTGVLGAVTGNLRAGANAAEIFGVETEKLTARQYYAAKTAGMLTGVLNFLTLGLANAKFGTFGEFTKKLAEFDERTGVLFTLFGGGVVLIDILAGAFKGLWKMMVQIAIGTKDAMVAIVTPIIDIFTESGKAFFSAFGPLPSVFQKTEGMIVHLTDALEGLGKIIGGITRIIGQLVGGIIFVLGTVVKAVAHVIGKVMSAVVEFLAPVFESITQALTGVFEIVSGIANLNFSKLASGIYDLMAGVGKAAAYAIIGIIPAILKAFVGVFAGLFSYVGSWADETTGVLGAVFRLILSPVKIIGKLAQGIFDTISGISNVLTGLVTLDLDRLKTGLVQVFTSLPGQIIDSFYVLGKGILQVLSEVPLFLMRVIKDVFVDLPAWMFTTIKDGLVALPGVVFDSLISGLSKLAKDDWFGPIFEPFVGLAKQMKETLAAVFEPFVSIFGMLSEVWTELRSSLDGILGPADKAAGTLSILGGALKFFTAILAGVVKALAFVIGTALKVVLTPIILILKGVALVANVVAKGVTAVMAVVKPVIQGIFQMVSGVFGVLAGLFSFDFSKMGNGIANLFAGLGKIIFHALAAIPVLVWKAVSGIGSILWKGIKAIPGLLWEGIKLVASTLLKAVGYTILGIVALFVGMPGLIIKGLYKAIVGGVKMLAAPFVWLFDKVASGWKSLTKGISDLFDWLGLKWANFKNGVMAIGHFLSTPTEWLTAIKRLGNWLFESAKDAFGKALDWMISKLPGGTEAVKAIGQTEAQFVESRKKENTIAHGIGGVVSGKKWEGVKEITAATGEGIVSAAKSVGSGIKSFFSKLNPFAEGTQKITQSGVGILHKGEMVVPNKFIAEGNGPFRPEATQQASTVANLGMSASLTNTTGAGQMLGQAVASQAEGVATLAQDGFNLLKKTITDKELWKTAVGGFQQLTRQFGKLKELIGKSEFVTHLSEEVGKLKTMAGKSRFVTGVTEKVNAVKQSVASEGVVKTAQKGIAKAQEIVTPIIQSISSKIVTLRESIGNQGVWKTAVDGAVRLKESISQTKYVERAAEYFDRFKQVVGKSEFLKSASEDFTKLKSIIGKTSVGTIREAISQSKVFDNTVQMYSRLKNAITDNKYIRYVAEDFTKLKSSFSQGNFLQQINKVRDSFTKSTSVQNIADQFMRLKSVIGESRYVKMVTEDFSKLKTVFSRSNLAQQISRVRESIGSSSSVKNIAEDFSKLKTVFSKSNLAQQINRVRESIGTTSFAKNVSEDFSRLKNVMSQNKYVRAAVEDFTRLKNTFTGSTLTQQITKVKDAFVQNKYVKAVAEDFTRLKNTFSQGNFSQQIVKVKDAFSQNKYVKAVAEDFSRLKNTFSEGNFAQKIMKVKDAFSQNKYVKAVAEDFSRLKNTFSQGNFGQQITKVKDAFVQNKYVKAVAEDFSRLKNTFSEGNFAQQIVKVKDAFVQNKYVKAVAEDFSRLKNTFSQGNFAQSITKVKDAFVQNKYVKAVAEDFSRLKNTFSQGNFAQSITKVKDAFVQNKYVKAVAEDFSRLKNTFSEGNFAQKIMKVKESIGNSSVVQNAAEQFSKLRSSLSQGNFSQQIVKVKDAFVQNRYVKAVAEDFSRLKNTLSQGNFSQQFTKIRDSISNSSVVKNAAEQFSKLKESISSQGMWKTVVQQATKFKNVLSDNKYVQTAVSDFSRLKNAVTQSKTFQNIVEIASKAKTAISGGEEGGSLLTRVTELGGKALTATKSGLQTAGSAIGRLGTSAMSKAPAFLGEAGGAVTKFAGSALAKAAPAMKFAGKILGPISAAADVAIGGYTGAKQAKAEGRTGIEGGVLGSLTGDSTTGSSLSKYVGIKKDTVADKTMGVLGAAGRGALIGATVGSFIPVVGTAVGAGVGALVGGATELFKWFTKKKQPETAVTVNLQQQPEAASSVNVQEPQPAPTLQPDKSLVIATAREVKPEIGMPTERKIIVPNIIPATTVQPDKSLTVAAAREEFKPQIGMPSEIKIVVPNVVPVVPQVESATTLGAELIAQTGSLKEAAIPAMYRGETAQTVTAERTAVSAPTIDGVYDRLREERASNETNVAQYSTKEMSQIAQAANKQVELLTILHDDNRKIIDLLTPQRVGGDSGARESTRTQRRVPMSATNYGNWPFAKQELNPSRAVVSTNV
jgi:hypothetical protein